MNGGSIIVVVRARGILLKVVNPAQEEVHELDKSLRRPGSGRMAGQRGVPAMGKLANPDGVSKSGKQAGSALSSSRRRKVRPCSSCGHSIRVWWPQRDGTILSEYVDAKGQCWECARL